MTEIEIIGKLPPGVLSIGNEERAILKKLKEHAEANIVPEENLNNREAVGVDDNYVAKIPADFRVVFSLEQQPLGLMRHLSLSVSRPGRIPHLMSLQMIAENFDFRTDANESLDIDNLTKNDNPNKVIFDGGAVRWTEAYIPDGGRVIGPPSQTIFTTAINLLEKIDIDIH
jgi:hypothetical protein